MGYTTFKNGTQPELNDTILNNMQVELIKLKLIQIQVKF